MKHGTDNTDNNRKHKKGALDRDQDRLTTKFFALRAKKEEMKKPYYKMLANHQKLARALEKSREALETFRRGTSVNTRDLTFDIKTLFHLGDIGNGFDKVVIIDSDSNTKLIRCINDIFDKKPNSLIDEYPAIAASIRKSYVLSSAKAEYGWRTEYYANDESTRVWQDKLVLKVNGKLTEDGTLVVEGKWFDKDALQYEKEQAYHSKKGYFDRKVAPVTVTCLKAKK
jgi:hypothetical protein